MFLHRTKLVLPSPLGCDDELPVPITDFAYGLIPVESAKLLHWIPRRWIILGYSMDYSVEAYSKIKWYFSIPLDLVTSRS